MFNFNEMFGKTRNDLKIINKDLENLNSKKIAVIGGTGGIGRALANAASNRGAEVIVVGRTFRENPETSKIKFVQADLSSMKTSLSIAKKLEAKNLDIVIMTQGIFSGRTKQVTEEGIELDMAVSHLSRFVILRHLVLSLGKNLKSEQAKPRVFIMGFPGGYREVNIDDFNSEKSYDWKQAHYNTVVANEALVLDSVERFTNVNFFGLNPGLIKSQILTNLIGEGLFFRFQQMMLGWFFQSDAEYAQKNSSYVGNT